MMYYTDGFIWHSIFGGLFMVLAWGALIVFIIWVVRGFPRNTTGFCSKGESSALTILKERYARGEIGKEEFEVKKKDLSE